MYRLIIKNGLSISLLTLTASFAVIASPPFVPVTLDKLNIPNKQCNVRDYGAEATGIWYDTKAFQTAINDCAQNGGGKVIVPAGYYLSEPLFLKSNIEFHLEKGAVVQASAEESAYHPSEEQKKWSSSAESLPLTKQWIGFINIAEEKNIAITGEGIIDGQGSTLLEKYRAETRQAGKKGPTNRPRLLLFKNANNILVEGVTIQNSPSFHIVFKNVEDITINKTTISAPAWWQNTDAIDPMDSRRVSITKNTISVGDDHVAIKSTVNNLSHDFYIADNNFMLGRGLSIGSETYGGVSNLLAENNTFTDAMYGIRIKSPRGKGGEVKDIEYNNTTMVNVKTPIVLSAYYKGGPTTKDAKIKALQEGEFAGGFMLGDQIYPADTEQPKEHKQTPYFNNISFNKLTVKGKSNYAGFIIGTPEKPFNNIRFSNINIEAENGFKIRNASVEFSHTKINVEKGSDIIKEKGSHITHK
ncbi:glycoside hydrolase family 28 protein [Gilliamella sp. B2894]|uniref:glycoside hydrolase family 28 protein n=1 Tax=unclassified Gilliamella TaxID=2685620 RepID=UPI00226A5643|nr:MULTISPECIES: glycoside hydrolase family 28 protein [unclassified Gilliamella]MCX8656843.1 glycoside hydrolase family 28 protein [Gilliamella sp. B2894]MCX8694046.1 glycoside hydrolase family 28 protein [Gilliamella sp. B2881]MCX8696766.1 glycoside hydrolase family 28 protein [Gilliamella sp. B2828]